MSFAEIHIQLRQIQSIIRQAKLLYQILLNVEKDYGIKDYILSENLKDIISHLTKLKK